MISFLSDYGPGDEYVGVVHGVIARIAPDVRVIDLGHGVPPQDVRTGARRLARALPFTPSGVHLAVVDPGVGGPRRAVALRAGRRWLVGPDNGLLLDAADRFGGVSEAFDVGDSPWRLEPVSATFHGRDVFGPVAAHLALGEPPRMPIDPAGLVRLPELRSRREGGATVAHVLEVDSFGNLRLNADPGDFAATVRVTREGGATVAHVLEVDSFGNLRLNADPGDFAATVRVTREGPTARSADVAARDAAVGRTFGDVAPGGLLLYVESDGGLALAVNGGSAAAVLGVRSGDEIRLAP